MLRLRPLKVRKRFGKKELGESALGPVITIPVALLLEALYLLNYETHCEHLMKGGVHFRQRQRTSASKQGKKLLGTVRGGCCPGSRRLRSLTQREKSRAPRTY